VLVCAAFFGVAWRGSVVSGTVSAHSSHDSRLDWELRARLAAAGFTGDIEKEFKRRLKNSLGRPLDNRLADLGRLLWFDNLHSLGRDNTCGGCHSPTNGMGDSQPMAIGVQSNGLVGPNRTGPRNQRRSPTVVNTALFPRLMWNNRFESLSGDPFDGSQGFSFPAPEGDERFSPAENRRNDVRHLLQAQAHIPPTELIEVGAFEGVCPGGVPQPGIDPRLCQFDVDGPGLPVPLPDESGFRNEPIRQIALGALNANAEYRKRFGQVFHEVKRGAPIDFFMFGKAIAEFEFTLVFANAPLDRFARGQHNAMSEAEKRGALLFFGKANCVSCHRVDGNSNEMFSDFREHVLGVPQVFPQLGVNTGNFIFSGPSENEDFGREERSGDPSDRYKFRTSPLRNLAVQAGFFHNGAYVDLEDAVRFHLSVVRSAAGYDPDDAGIPADLRQVGPVIPRALVDRRLRKPIVLSEREFKNLVRFLRTGLLDERMLKANLCQLIPASVPSGMPVLAFEDCQTP
jgi:cytochrome c peroxidase